jgi:hypothetical protein
MKPVHYHVLICACLLLPSCEPDPVIASGLVVFDQAQFDRERAAWNASNVKNYRFNMYVDIAPPTSIIRFVIENGEFKERKIIQTGYADDFYQNGFTIPAFYDAIERAVQDARKRYEGKNPDDLRFLIDVVYNTEHHFPVSMSTCEVYAVGNNTFEGESQEGTWSIGDFERGD